MPIGKPGVFGNRLSWKGPSENILQTFRYQLGDFIIKIVTCKHILRRVNSVHDNEFLSEFERFRRPSDTPILQYQTMRLGEKPDS